MGTVSARRMERIALARRMNTSRRSTGSCRRTRERIVLVSCQPEHGDRSGSEPNRGFAEGLPLLRTALQGTPADAKGELPPLIVESNSLLQFLRPSLYFSVVDPAKEDFKDSARVALDRADALVLRGLSDSFPSMEPAWMKLPSRLLREKPSVSQGEGEPLPEPLRVLVRRMLEGPPGVSI